MTALIPGLMFSGGLWLALSFFASLRPVPLASRLTPGNESIAWSTFIGSAIRSSIFGFFHPKKHLQKILRELPDFLELFAVALASGESIHSALNRVVPRLSGELAKQLQQSLRVIQYGASLENELTDLALRVPQHQLVEVCNKLINAMNRGTPLAGIVAEQAEAVRLEVSNHLLKQAGKNETKMLVPLVFLILPVTVLFAIYPSLQLLNMSFL
jgi:tight adherence protein C